MRKVAIGDLSPMLNSGCFEKLVIVSSWDPAEGYVLKCAVAVRRCTGILEDQVLLKTRNRHTWTV
jgi:hypothetical protein